MGQAANSDHGSWGQKTPQFKYIPDKGIDLAQCYETSSKIWI